jgi:hypothetical protein
MDGSSLAAVETATLTQGVAFLYAQAGELLRRRRQARDQVTAAQEQRVAQEQAPITTAAGAHATTPGSLPSLQLPNSVFESAGSGPPATAQTALDRLAGSLFQARRDVDDYVVGMAAFGGDSQTGLQAANRLRCLLEEIYDTAVTFRGEQRTAGRTTYVHVQDVGVAGKDINAKYIAGHDINIERA